MDQCKPANTMGLMFGLDTPNFKLCKRKFRWLFQIDGITDTNSGTVNMLPPLKSARPSLSFKEMEARHLTEHVYYPMKPEWKPINLILYDIKRDKHPVFEWIKKLYDVKQGTWKPSVSVGQIGPQANDNFIKPSIKLNLYDGIGNIIETWIYENVWPQVIEFGELDMGSNEFVTCDLTLRYVRAYIDN